MTDLQHQPPPKPGHQEPVGKARLEAFSDGVIAIIVTIMVLELKVPHGHELADLRPVLPVLLSYVLSFAFVGIYWVNHHHLLHALNRVTPSVMWANLHLLYWLSLVPAVTGWMGEHSRAPWPTALYASVLVMSGVAYTLLQKAVWGQHGKDTPLLAALANDQRKGKISTACYLASIGFAFVEPRISHALFVGVALIWLVPDRRILAGPNG